MAYRKRRQNCTRAEKRSCVEAHDRDTGTPGCSRLHYEAVEECVENYTEGMGLLRHLASTTRRGTRLDMDVYNGHKNLTRGEVRSCNYVNSACSTRAHGDATWWTCNQWKAGQARGGRCHAAGGGQMGVGVGVMWGSVGRQDRPIGGIRVAPAMSSTKTRWPALHVHHVRPCIARGSLPVEIYQMTRSPLMVSRQRVAEPLQGPQRLQRCRVT